MDNYIVRTTEDLLSDDICGEVFFDCTEKIIPAILDRAMRRITAFNVSEENPYYTSYEGILYSKDGKKVIKSPAKKSGSVKLHDGTEDICENAFAFSDIQSVTFPDSLKRIERRLNLPGVFISYFLLLISAKPLKLIFSSIFSPFFSFFHSEKSMLYFSVLVLPFFP